VATCAPSGQWQQMAGSGLDVANPRAVADAYDALSAVVTLDRERDGSAKHPTGLAATKPSNGYCMSNMHFAVSTAPNRR
jgi:hypothetical protein